MIPLVDVNIAVYNHAAFLRQTLDSVLAQKASFPFRLIIGDDCSTDGSTEILKEYAAKFPEMMLLILQEKNLGLKGKERNGLILLKKSSAKYIALLDGDDYWTDPLKLQKQVDFLENNPNFAICFHNSKIIYEDEPGKVSLSNPPSQSEISKFEDLAKGEFIYTVTCLFRHKDFIKFPEKYYYHINNYTLDLHNAQFGDIKYINEVMSVYRRHGGGMWSMVARDKILIEHLPTYKFYINYFDKRYRHFFIDHVKKMTSELVSIKLQKKDLTNFWRYYLDYVFYNYRDKKQLRRIPSLGLKAAKLQMKKLIPSNG